MNEIFALAEAFYHWIIALHIYRCCSAVFCPNLYLVRLAVCRVYYSQGQMGEEMNANDLFSGPLAVTLQSRHFYS